MAGDEGDVVTVGRHRRLADSEDSDDDNDEQDTILTTAKASDLCPKDYRLIATRKGFTKMESMSTLRSLDYVDLTGNVLRSVEGLSANWRLKTLILRGNKLPDVEPLLKISAIRILNIAENEIATLEWLPRAKFASELLTLVASGNKLASLDGLSCLGNLRTLVISQNNIEDIAAVARLQRLTKLSASNNCIRMIPDTFSSLHDLGEIRLAHNRISALPSKEIMVRLVSLKILDMGHNRLTSLDELSCCGNSLTNVSVRKNPASSADDEGRQMLIGLCPRLEIIDGHRVAGGRRKLRVNRQRMEAGFPLEPERKFARPPPRHYAKDKQDKKRARSDNDLAYKEQKTGPDSSVGSAIEPAEGIDTAGAQGRDSQPKKKARRKLEKPEEGAVLEASDFVRDARSKSLVLPSGMKDGVNVKISEHASRPKQGKRKSVSNKQILGDDESLRDQLHEFGSGGPSQWA